MTSPQVCAFDSNDCSHSMHDHGDFDEHHEWPKHLGGADDQSTMLLLCPNHHRRQHSLIRYLIECREHGLDPAWAVLCHFVSAERDTARYAVDRWASDPNGPHPVEYWSASAARETP